MIKVNYKTIYTFFLVYILSINENIHCKDIDIQETQKINNDIDNRQIERTINVGGVQEEILYNKKIYIFNFGESSDYSNDILVHFYSIDCPIEIYVKDENIKVENIDNYEYDAYYTIIEKEKLNSTKFEIRPIIHSYKDYNKNKEYHLIINSVLKQKDTTNKDFDNSELLLKEKIPTFLYFNNNLNTIKLVFEIKEKIEKAMCFSFFIKERVKFNVKVNKYQESEEIIKNKKIGYIDNIIITPEELNYISVYPHTISFLINKDNGDKKIATMNIRVVSNYLSPSYIYKNLFYLGFMPNNVQKQFFYIEVFKNEEGEIVLNNKRCNGTLISKIINKNEVNNNNIPQKFPNYFSSIDGIMLTYDEYSQKLIFNGNDTDTCEEGCYIFIEYISEPLHIQTIQGTEFSLLCRIWDAEEYIPQIINIPLNEYIYGSYENHTIIHHYTIFIPNDAEVIFELHGNNIEGYIKKGIIKINIKKSDTKKLTEEDNFDTEKLIISLNNIDLGIDNYENKYISFAFSKESNLIKYSNYYFRVLQKNTNKDCQIYPLDTNKANYCNPSKLKGKNVCFFLLKNDYNDLSTNYAIYGHSIDEVEYTLWNLTQNDYYSINITDILKNNSSGVVENNIFTSNNSLLIEISSKDINTITIYCDYLGNVKSPSLNIYSFQLFYFYFNETKIFNFNYSLMNEYNININPVKGKGKMCFNQECDTYSNQNDIIISDKNYHSFIVTKNSEKENFYLYTEENLFFRMKINYKNENNIIQEIQLGKSEKTNIDFHSFPIMFYIKDYNSEGVDINFKINFEENINDYEFRLICNKQIITYQQIKYLHINKALINDIIDKGKEGEFDEVTKTGLIIFDKMFIEEHMNFNEDNYFILIIGTYYSYNRLPLFSLDIFVDSKDSEINHHNMITTNKYIRGSFNKNLFNEPQEQIYYFGNKDNSNKKYVLEFSSNSNNINLIFNKIEIKKNETDKTKNFGFDRYIISLSNNSYSYLTVQKKNVINNDININYILRIYEMEEDDDNDDDIILDKAQSLKSDLENSIELTLYNKNKKETGAISNSQYFYFLKIYSKDSLKKNEILNTIAKIEQKSENNEDVLSLSKVVGPEDDISFNLTFLEKNKQYFATYFIIVKKFNKENYYSLLYEFFINKEDNKGLDKNIILVIIIVASSIAIILFIISIIIYKICKKNKSLISKIQSISFAQGIDDTDNSINKTKSEDDYENTFI